MNIDVKMPGSLKIVAWMFVLAGLNSLINTLISFNTNHINISVDAIKLYIGMRLFRRSKSSRKAAVFFVCLDFILIPLAWIILLSTPQRPTDFRLFGYTFGKIPMAGLLLWLILILLFNVWQYKILNTQKTRRFFSGGK